MLIAWIKKKLGYHVCEEFTQWEDYKVVAEVRHVMGEIDLGTQTVQRYVQLRRCTICGELQTRRVNLHVVE